MYYDNAVITTRRNNSVKAQHWYVQELSAMQHEIEQHDYDTFKPVQHSDIRVRTLKHLKTLIRKHAEYTEYIHSLHVAIKTCEWVLDHPKADTSVINRMMLNGCDNKTAKEARDVYNDLSDETKSKWQYTWEF
jgi:hypothetical protein